MKSGIPFSDDWKGLGYIKLKGIILDPDTIQQVQDGRFDAVSTSFSSPGEAYCSTCAQNLAKDGFCEHEPGQVYSDGDDEDDEVVCAIIPGRHKYQECSLVVFDADPLTQISIGHDETIKDFSVSAEDWQNNSNEDANNIAFSFRDYKEETTMADNINLSDAEQKVLVVVKELRPELEDSKAIEFAKKLVVLQDKEGKYPYQEEANLDDETALLYSLENIETADQKINADAIADEMLVELKAMADEGLVKKEDYEAADAKISTEARKKLSGSTFCGPERSFPVPDCAHVTAARRLIGRYKGPGNKTEILACVSRKAKALGCDSEDAAPVESQEEVKLEVPTCDMVATLNSEEVKQLFNLAESEMISRQLKLDRPCGKCAAAEDRAINAENALQDSETKVVDLNNTLGILRGELRLQMSEYTAQVDRYIELGVELVALKKDHLATVGTLSGKFETMEKAMDSLSLGDLLDHETMIMKDFKIEDFLDSGMARDPKGDVENPVVNKDIDNNQIPDGLRPSALASIESIRDFIKDSEMKKAKELYVKMVRMKVLDEKLVSFESLSAKPTSAE
jgi:hypothetical protein